jgi:hypothetical protein
MLQESEQNKKKTRERNKKEGTSARTSPLEVNVLMRKAF